LVHDGEWLWETPARQGFAMTPETIAKMGLAFERACRHLPESTDARKHVAAKIVECAKTHTQTLAGLTEAGRQAVAEFSGLPDVRTAPD
jgi:hypothetical protein